MIITVSVHSPSGAKPKVTERVNRSAIVYVNDPAAELPLEQGVRLDLPQFATPRLVEPSFLVDLHTILTGRTQKDYLEEFKEGAVDASVALRSVARAVPIPGEYSIVLYVCSDELCKLLGAADEKRVTEIADRWRALLWPRPEPYEPEPESRRQFRAVILAQLVTLAQEALRSDRKLMVRLEYRQRRRDAETGMVRETQSTRH